MSDPQGHVSADARSATAAARDDVAWGWYLYGVMRAGQPIAGYAGEPSHAADEQPIETIREGELQAVVRRVPLAEFAPEAIQARSHDPNWLEAMAVRHNAVLGALHAESPILPARFGAVYVSPDDVRRALRDAYPLLLAQLNRIEGCDEWGIRLFGQALRLLLHAEAEDARVRQVRDELATAKPGRAYFLQRKLAEARANVAEGAIDALVDRVYSVLASEAADGHVTSRASGAHLRGEGEIQVMRASFLVPRSRSDAFTRTIQTLAESQPDVRYEYSGPWPPYSFASSAGGDAR